MTTENKGKISRRTVLKGAAAAGAAAAASAFPLANIARADSPHDQDRLHPEL